MKKLFILFVLVIGVLTVSAQKPNVVILATGGTIAGAAATEVQAGYQSGQVGVDVLINAVPQLKDLANITGEQISNIGSQNMSDVVWLKLAKRCNELLKKDDVDGIVITHGTDTMEETAYFLNLVVKSKKPVVLTCSMRPSTALSADGPLNIFNAVAVAASKDAWDRGVMVVTNDLIHSGRAAIKGSTTAVETFFSPLVGPLGTVNYGEINFVDVPNKKYTYQTEFNVDDVSSLPRVDVIAIYEDAPGDLIKAAVDLGAKGIVTTGLGNGNLTDACVEALKYARSKGVVVVRGSRVITGFVGRNIELDDDALG
ncbi:MAG: type II asparaginase, partial [Ignavibacteria bacterium]